MPHKLRAQGAFTYIELMMVLTIIALLAAIAIPNFLEAKVRAGVARTKGELALIGSALEAYRLDHKMYPATRGGEPDGNALVALTTPVVYMAALPKDFFSTFDQNAAATPQPGTFYQYYNVQGIGIAKEEGLIVREQDVEHNTKVDGYHLAAVWGVGPDRNEIDTVIAEGGGEMIINTYDPTNGTTSSGDIYQVVP